MDKRLKQVGARLRECRQAKGFTVRRLSLLTGIDKTQISNIERGEVNLKLLTLFKLTDALKIYMSDIFVDEWDKE